MNDFTKEQLETMRNAIFWGMVSSSLWRIPENNLLVDKIQSMIDNYCEHDAEIGKDYPAEKCMKCGAMWE